jgi:hypothetical protein
MLCPAGQDDEGCACGGVDGLECVPLTPSLVYRVAPLPTTAVLTHLLPQSPVTLADGSTLPIEHIRPGMLMWGGACVQHVVRIDYDAVVPMVSLPGVAGNAAIS